MRQPTTRHKATSHEPEVLQAVGALVRCPDDTCRQLAEVVDAWRWRSTDGPVSHARTRCLARHVFTWPSRLLTPAQL